MRRALLVIAVAACSHGDPPATTQQAAAAPSPLPATAHGRVTTERFHSTALGVDKDYVVYLPADYETSGKHYPVFYYLHGLGGNEHDWVEGGHLAETADKLGLAAIVVMPDGDDAFYADGVAPIDYAACMKDASGLFLQKQRAKTCVKKRDYETYITKDLVAEVDGKYRTLATKQGRAIAGLSMGGFGALELSLRHTDEYAAAASHSGIDALLYVGPHPYVAGKVELLEDVKQWGVSAPIPDLNPWMRGIFGDDLATWQQHDPAYLAQQLAPGALALYLDCGTEDIFALNDGALYLHDLLLARKIDHAFYIGPGHHDFRFWVARLPESLKFLRDHTAKPS
ncbi:MAG: alpha/beta hydrolase [Acidobacteriota bacterium]